MACCLAALSYYSNQYRLIVKCVLCNSQYCSYFYPARDHSYDSCWTEFRLTLWYILQILSNTHYNCWLKINEHRKLNKTGLEWIHIGWIFSSCIVQGLWSVRHGGEILLAWCLMSCHLYKRWVEVLCNTFNHIQYYTGTSYINAIYNFLSDGLTNMRFWKEIYLYINNIHFMMPKWIFS